jgi:hypothetical protein
MKKLILFILFTVTLQFAFAQRKFYEGKWQSNSQYKITDTSAFIDTLRPKSLFPVSQGGDECATTVYLSPGGGYVTGTNWYNDIGCYQEYDLSQNFPKPIDNTAPSQITGMLVWFRYDSLGFFPGNVRGVAYSINDTTGAPDQLLDTSIIPASQVDTGSNVTFTYFNFPDTPTFFGKIAVGVEFIDAGTANVGIASTVSGCSQLEGYSWSRWHDSSYHTFADPYNANLDVDLYILPIVSHPYAASINNTSLLNGDLQIYPNPAENKTSLVYSLTKGGKVSVEISDALGRIVKQYPQQLQSSGNHIYQADLRNLEQGLYFVHLQINGKDVSVHKLSVNRS